MVLDQQELKKSAFNRTAALVISQPQHESPWWNSMENGDYSDDEYDIKD
jgi:hypothetical protein